MKATLWSTGTDAFLLHNHSPELNPIELAFNVVTHHFRARHHKSMFNTDDDVLNFLHEVINSITLDIVVSCYQKCGYVNYS